MADHTMNGHHSDLQLVSDDIAANAPERDRSTSAPEVYTTGCTLEVSPNSLSDYETSIDR